MLKSPTMLFHNQQHLGSDMNGLLLTVCYIIVYTRHYTYIYFRYTLYVLYISYIEISLY